MTTFSSVQRLVALRPGVFNATIVRGLTDPDGGLTSFRPEDAYFASTTALGETGSFRYDPIGSGIKSTQQLNVDWSLFENHVFFNSAQVKVNAAFNKIIDRYPFDGTRKDLELFVDGMTGFENFVFTSLPKNKGYLFFSGSNIGDTTAKGTWVTVKDAAGAPFPFLTKDPTGAPRLDPTSGSISVQFQIYAPTIANTNQIVLQKLQTISATEQHGFGCYLSQSLSTSTADLTFFVASGSTNVMSASVGLTKGLWTPVTFTWDRTSGTNQLFGYLGGTLAATSSQVDIGNLNFATASLYLGTGSNITAPLFTPTTTFSGGLDEIRYYKTVLSAQQISDYQNRSIYSSAELALYLKLNEPSGSTSNLILDYSGKGMHGTLNSYALNTLNVRNIATSSLFGESPMTHEDLRYCPILFPDHPEVVTLRETLLSDAVSYDQDNPNHITKLIPKNYLLYGQIQNGFDTEEGELDVLEYGSEPNTVELGNTQTVLSLLYMWASFFDEIKLFMDAFATLRHVDYNMYDTTPDAFLKQLADFYGLQLPPLMINSDINQFVNGTDITPTVVNSPNTLQYLQNQIWRRILINANDILKSKGTIHSIKAFLRSVGIEGDNIFRFREYGGPTQRTLANLRENRSDTGGTLSFNNGGYFISPYLSSSRVEPGYPEPAGTFVVDSSTGRNIGTSVIGDAYLTSGSWTCEAIYDFGGVVTSSMSQSFLRILTKNNSPTIYNNTLANLVAVDGYGVDLYVKPTLLGTALTMSITSSNVMNGKSWNVSFGRTRNDAIGQVSSSYFLRVARSHFGKIIEEYVTSSYYDDHTATNYFETSGSQNELGPLLSIGTGSVSLITTGGNFLNDRSIDTYEGNVSQLRFWSKALTVDEWEEHVRDYRSLGVEDPTLNFNFETSRSGSFERLRLDNSFTQPVTTSDVLGEIQLFDFSQNQFHGSGLNFPTSSVVINPKAFHYSHISPILDEAATSEKVRIRSFQNPDEINGDNGTYAFQSPVYEILQDQIPEDNVKFSIDFSVVDALNQDMINMFSSLDIFNNILGSPDMMFSPDYPELEVLRNVYFNRLTDKLNLKGYFDFYKWFNTNIGKFIEQLLPRKVRFKGINYIIESHMLERAKVEYHFEDQYLGEKNRSRQKEGLYLQSFTGLLRKF